jgi:hypothetical protein
VRAFSSKPPEIHTAADQQRLVRSREALHCSPFLHRCHPIGPRHRFGLCQTQEAHISPDGFARDGRRWAAASARRTGQYWARRSEEKQHHHCDLHRASPSVLRSNGGLHTSDSTSLNVAGREGLGAVHRRAVNHLKFGRLLERHFCDMSAELNFGHQRSGPTYLGLDRLASTGRLLCQTLSHPCMTGHPSSLRCAPVPVCSTERSSGEDIPPTRLPALAVIRGPDRGGDRLYDQKCVEASQGSD